MLPKLYAAGWDDTQISEQKSFTDGRIVVVGSRASRRQQKRADYLLRYRRDFPIAVVEAKAAYRTAGDGLQQARNMHRSSASNSPMPQTVWAANGKHGTLVTISNVVNYQADLNTIGLYTSEDATILLSGCLSGQGEEGTKFLITLSRIWPKRTVVGFRTLGYRHPGAMKRLGEPCELPGMREIDATAELYANPPKYDAQWSDLKKMPWGAATTRFAKVVKDGHIIRCPDDELFTLPEVAKPPVTTKHGAHRRR